MERRSKDATFPKLFRLSKLAREFSFAGVDIDQTEFVLRKKILTPKTREKIDNDHHESKIILEQFLASPVESDDRQTSLQNLFESFERIQKSESENIENPGSKDGRVKVEKTGSSLNRISYFVLVLRLGFALENAVRQFHPVGLMIKRLTLNLTVPLRLCALLSSTIITIYGQKLMIQLYSIKEKYGMQLQIQVFDSAGANGEAGPKFVPF